MGQQCQTPCLNLGQEGWPRLRLAVEQRRLPRITGCIGRELRDLDVMELGAGCGALGSALLKVSKDYAGFEPCRMFQQALPQAFPQLSGRVCNSVLPPPDQSGRFDLAVAVDVLEFVPRPAEFIRQASAFLKDGGWFYGEVADEGWMRQRMRLRWLLGLYSGQPLHPGHCNFFSMQALRESVRLSGLSLVRALRFSLISDSRRLSLTLGRQAPWHWRLACAAIAVSGADLLCRQGGIAFAARKAYA